MNPRQQHFVQEHLIDPNPTRAAIRAGYSKKTARSIGQENLTKPDIAQAIQRAQAKRSERLQVTADDVAQELALIGFGDVGDFFGPDGNLLDVNELSHNAKRRLGSVEVLREHTHTNGDVHTVEQTLKIKPWDKIRALDLPG